MTELFLEQIEEAKKALEVADHLTYVTFPLMGDNKILNMITDNLNIALIKTMDSLLNYDKYYKRIYIIPEDFENKFDVLKNEVAKRYNISNETLLMIKEIKDIHGSKKKTNSLDIKRDFSFIHVFKSKTPDLKKIKDYINDSKLLIEKVNTIIGKNVRGL